MIEMHSKYDNMHKNGMFYALICIINHFLRVKIACYQFLPSLFIVGCCGANLDVQKRTPCKGTRHEASDGAE